MLNFLTQFNLEILLLYFIKIPRSKCNPLQQVPCTRALFSKCIPRGYNKSMTLLSDNDRSRGSLQFATSIGVKRPQRNEVLLFPRASVKTCVYHDHGLEARNVLSSSGSTYHKPTNGASYFWSIQKYRRKRRRFDNLTPIDILSSMHVKEHRTFADAMSIVATQFAEKVSNQSSVPV